MENIERLSERAEARSVAFTDVDTSNGGKTFEGYAAIYHQETDIGPFREVIVTNAFDGVLERSGNLPMLWDHNAGMPPLATTGAGTLEVRVDGRGLRVKADINERHILGPTVMSMVERGEVRGMSIGFIVGAGNSKVSASGDKPLRVIRSFNQLLDVSPTWNPAYAGTSAELRSLRQMASIIDDSEQDIPAVVPELDVQADVEHQTGEQDPAICTCGAVLEEGDICECEIQAAEERSGVEADLSAAAARKRRLQILGLSIPKDDVTRSMPKDIERRAARPTRRLDEVLRFPRETWSVEEQRAVVGRLKQVQDELMEIMDREIRGRRETDDADRYKSLQDEFALLRG